MLTCWKQSSGMNILQYLGALKCNSDTKRFFFFLASTPLKYVCPILQYLTSLLLHLDVLQYLGICESTLIYPYAAASSLPHGPVNWLLFYRPVYSEPLNTLFTAKVSRSTPHTIGTMLKVRR